MVAVEPGPDLRQQLLRDHPGVRVLGGRVEDDALGEHGLLAVWRTVFGDPRVETEFRRRMMTIVAGREEGVRVESILDPRPSVAELEAGRFFGHVRTWQWPWHIDLTPRQVGRLFGTFSDWSPHEVDAVVAVATQAGPVVREHYVRILHVLRRV